VGLEISLGGASKIPATVNIYSCGYTLLRDYLSETGVNAEHLVIT
jgi:hypothetical protein